MYIVGIYIALILFFTFWKDKIDTIIAFSLHKRSFSNTSLCCTIVATMIGATGFAVKINTFYFEGWKYLIVVLGMPLQTILLCKFIIPRSTQLLGCVSVSTFMGKHYGDTVRVITAITSSIGVCGFIASQYKIIGITGSMMFPQIETEWFICAAVIIVGWYSYTGGIHSVILTDVVQTICFSIAFIAIIYFMYPTASSTVSTLSNPDYNTDIFFLTTAFKGVKIDKALHIGLLFLYFFIPSFSSTQFQRIALARNPRQLSAAWWFAALALTIATFIPCYISYWIFLKNPNLATNDIYPYLVRSLEYGYIKGIFIVGVLSMAMSTADSHLNTASINLANDSFRRHSLSSFQKLTYARNYIIVISLAAVGILFIKNDFLKIVLFANSFYMPLITVPLIGLILGYKTTKRCMLAALTVTSAYVIISHILIYFSIISLEPVMPAMFLNLVLLTLAHHVIEKWNLLAHFGLPSQLKK